MVNIDEMMVGVISFRERFGLESNLDAQMRKVFEEFREFTQAVDFYDALSNFEPESRVFRGQLIVNEFMDVVYSGLNALVACGITTEQVNEAARVTIFKNEAKSPETHFVNDKGLVERRNGRTETPLS